MKSLPQAARDPVPRTTDVVVIGGGLAGLTAASLLGRAGRRVVLLERNAQLGGRARAQERAGFHLNLGPHALYLGGAGAEVLRDLDVAYTGARPPDGGLITRQGRRPEPIPATLLALLTYRGLSLPERLQAVRLFASIARGPLPPTGLSFDGWLEQRRASPDFVALFRAFLRLSTYVAASDRLSAAAGVMQLRQALSGVVYLGGGWEALVNGISQRAREAGVTFHTACSVQLVHDEGAGVVVVLRNGDVITADTVILSVPPREVLELLGPLASTQMQQFAQQSQPVLAACLDVGLRRLPRPKVAYALDLELPRYMSCHSVAAGIAPPNCTLLQLAYYGEAGAAGRGSLENWLDTLQPGWREEVLMQRWLPAARVCEALPSAEQGGLPGRPPVDAAGPDRVFLCGDWVGPVGLLSDASFASAREAATRILRN